MLLQNNEDSFAPHIDIDALDKPFDETEIKNAIKKLVRNKSSGYNKIVFEFFIDANDFISPFLVPLFNRIYETGEYPKMWSKSIIVPIYKKDDPNNPENYRGITLICSLAKIFSLCLMNR